jgi:PTH2 family peptidyl-tRNA hydrolase
MSVEPNMYDDAELAKMRSEQADPMVQYLIVKKSLKMSGPKLAAQCCHGVGIMLLRYFDLFKNQSSWTDKDKQKIQAVEFWIEQSFRKIVLGADDKDWEKIKEATDVFLVRDAGLTEIDPGSETVLATWPMLKSQVPKIIKRLQALKDPSPEIVRL